ncbi:MAG TPA: M13 family metallopeptidase [Lysobacter sp.]
MNRLAVLLALFVCGPALSREDDILAFDPSTFDSGVDVCRDPYAYANNRWMETATIPDAWPMWGPRYAAVARNQAQQRALAEKAMAEVEAGTAQGAAAQVGMFFASGMDQAAVDTAGLRSIAADLQRIEAIDTRQKLVSFITDNSVDGLDLVFGYNVWPRGDDPARNLIYLQQGGLGLDDRALYLAQDERSQALRTAYRGYLAKLLELSGVAANTARSQAEAALALETALAEASLSNTELRQVDNVIALRTFDEVATLAPRIGWPQFFARHGHAAVREVSLAQPDFFRALDRQLADAPLAHWRAYLRARLLDRMAPYLAAAFADQHFAFHSTAVRGIPAPGERWESVLDALNAGPAHFAMGQLFVATHLPTEAKPRALAMIEDLRAAFRVRIEHATWMGEATRQAALTKLERMGVKIGYPDHWPDLSGLEFRRDDYAGNLRATWRFARRRENAKLTLPTDRTEWFSPAHEINARYDPQNNEIVFPAPMLTAPAFDPNLDPALNYAVLGAIIGHEMTHGFDDTGAQFDALGRQHNWWAAEDKQRFTALGDRVVERYAQLEIAPGQRVDGRLTLSENIADLGGVAIAYDALQRAQARRPQPRIDALDQDQRFFLRYATVWRNLTRPQFAQRMLRTDAHAPDRFRADVPLLEHPAFAKAFGCDATGAKRETAQAAIAVW